jgi:hypothetical protein
VKEEEDDGQVSVPRPGPVSLTNSSIDSSGWMAIMAMTMSAERALENGSKRACIRWRSHQGAKGKVLPSTHGKH